jgi:hypothetical protein
MSVTDRRPRPDAASARAPRLRVATFEDYPSIYRIAAHYFSNPMPPDQWRRMFTDNPLWPRLGRSWPIGWVLEDVDGQVIGSFSNIPSMYYFQGTECLSGNGKSWHVLPGYRGRGYALWLVTALVNQEQPEITMITTIGAAATPIVSRLLSRVPLGDWSRRSFRILRYQDFARRALIRKGVPATAALTRPLAAGLRARDALFAARLQPVPRVFDVEYAEHFDHRFDRFWEELRRRNPGKLLGVRDSAALNWRFGGAIREGRMKVWTASRGGLLRAYCIINEHMYPGFEAQSLRIMDYQTVVNETDLLPGLLRVALTGYERSGAHILEMLGSGLPKMRSFEKFARAGADKPWSFYYHSVDTSLATVLRRPEVWDASGFDGDASLDYWRR